MISYILGTGLDLPAMVLGKGNQDPGPKKSHSVTHYLVKTIGKPWENGGINGELVGFNVILWDLPSGKLTVCYGNSSLGKLTI